MIYKITNIRLRNGRTLNRGFIIESDKMLSRNKIATLIKERTNFTPIDFSAKMHRNLFESQKDVDDAIAAGEEIKRQNREHNKSAKEHNDNLKAGYRTAYNQKRSDAEAAAREKDKNSELRKKSKESEELKNTQTNFLQTKEEELSKKQNELNAKNNRISEIDKEIERLNGEKTKISTEEIPNLQTQIDDTNQLITSIKTTISDYEKEATTNKQKADKELNAALTNIAAQYPELEDDLIDTIEEYKKDFDEKKMNEIGEDDGVNLTKVTNYFDKKEADLTNIIKKFRDKVKMKKEGGVNKAVYTRLNDTLNKFEKSFEKIKKYVIAQYSSNENKKEK